ncbi:44261_t:CDS:2 [Gigaspora margarita]|uniref:44261_t:CDS:1 n=1 Tax=Gigaspora margarita TaxID=4874 RepID=A0ABN7VXY1_GIGMA|nr:44261_t:CDS:2 [Gigaspora margarita]
MSKNFEKNCYIFMQNNLETNLLESDQKNQQSQKKNRSLLRPPNAFILYRKHIYSMLKKEPDFEFYKFHTSKISKFAGERWRSESEEIKLKFERLANAAKSLNEAVSPFPQADLNSQLPIPDLSKTLPPLPT